MWMEGTPLPAAPQCSGREREERLNALFASCELPRKREEVKALD